MIFADEVFAGDRLRAAIGAAYRADETACVKALLRRTGLGAAAKTATITPVKYLVIFPLLLIFRLVLGPVLPLRHCEPRVLPGLR